MANAIYLASISIPMTEKPSTLWEPTSYKTYEDLFRIQNTVRMILTDFVEEAPADGKQYVRQNSSWEEMSGGGGGGGGGIPEAPVDGKLYGRKNSSWEEVPSGGGGSSAAFNLYITGNRTGVDNNYRGYTVFALLSSGALLNKSNSWKFSMWLQATAAFNIGPIKLLKTSIGSPTVISSHPVTLGGSATPLITPPGSGVFRVTTDTITTPIDGSTDVWIAVYFPTSNTVNNNVGIMEASSYVKGFYIQGDHTGAATIPGSPSTPYLVSHVQQI